MKNPNLIQLFCIIFFTMQFILCFLSPENIMFYILNMLWILNTYISQETVKTNEETIKYLQKQCLQKYTVLLKSKK
jgi:hypothetical protein